MPQGLFGDDLQELYQQLILDHNRSPRNFKVLEEANHQAEGFNPLCGDKISVYVNVRNKTIEDISFMGSGCAISKASASIMTESLKGKTQVEVLSLFDAFHTLVTSGEQNSLPLGKLAVLAGVHKYPVRVKCATLCWHTMKNALASVKETATTE